MTTGEHPTKPQGATVEADRRRAEEQAALERLETWVSILLRAGALTSLAVVFVGAVTTLVQHPDYLADPAALGPMLAPHATTRTLAGIAHGLARGEGEAITLLGLLLLIATPVLRVALSVATFLRARDRAFALLTLAVLGLLLLSFLLGRAG